MENHTVTIDNRKSITVTDIKEIDSFDEEQVRVCLSDGVAVIKGSGLHIQLLDLKEGRAVMEGTIDSLMYIKVKNREERNLFSRLLK